LLPELLRTQGDIMLAMQPEDRGRAEECYRKALEQARTDGAVGWELRAANSLARLWRQTQRAADAAELLQRTLSKFAEGFETADIVDARQLLQSTLGARRDERRKDGSRSRSNRKKPAR
jgi:predicted ATPase